ncbi:hypothetical protein Patl1_05965 [Pistacia atlantica]|uniref:Uncharacterized protein n=1 Tax=Pistacia atlantica TaxID=434234 RepID=A0ACC1BQ28_9ROSI|nr:hypothetical protein Patl1_05965 [Pistacia atlantica]
MAESYTKIITKNEDQSGRKNLLSLFTDFRLNFPPFNRETKSDVISLSESETVPVHSKEETDMNKKKDVLKFSDPKPVIPPPLKLEVEDYSNPAAQWLVCSLSPVT